MTSKTIRISLLAGSLLLAACHQNPLKQTSPEKASRALVDAALDAEAFLQLEGGGTTYPACIKQSKVPPSCEALLTQMLDHLKENPAFKTIKRQDLTDQTFFASIEDHYKEKRFLSL